MEFAVGFILFWCVSYLGYLGGRHLKVSAPAILGPVACFMILTLLGIRLPVPSFQKPLLSVITGVFLGLRMNHSLKGVYRQLLVYVTGLILLSLAGIWVLTTMGIDRETAFFAAMPGGMAEITLMSLNYHSDPFVTVLLQSSRMLISMTFFSSLAAKYRRCQEERTDNMRSVSGKKISLLLWGILILISLAAAKLLDLFHMPAANILGSMLVVGAAVRKANLECKINRKLQTMVQIGIGGLTGVSISRESMMEFPHYVLPVILLSLLVVGFGLLMAYLLMKLTGWDKLTCILSCCPAGLSPTIMVAMEYGADTNIVTIFQVIRMVTVLLMTPVMIRFLV